DGRGGAGGPRRTFRHPGESCRRLQHPRCGPVDPGGRVDRPSRHGGLGGRPMTTAELSFAYGAGRTFLTRQNVRYPFHITKALHLDSASPALATVLLQSSSGGIYGGDELDLRI